MKNIKTTPKAEMLKHELNNLLETMQFLKIEEDDDIDDIEFQFECINHQCEHLNTLVNDLHAELIVAGNVTSDGTREIERAKEN